MKPHKPLADITNNGREPYKDSRQMEGGGDLVMGGKSIADAVTHVRDNTKEKPPDPTVDCMDDEDVRNDIIMIHGMEAKGTGQMDPVVDHAHTS